MKINIIQRCSSSENLRLVKSHVVTESSGFVYNVAESENLRRLLDPEDERHYDHSKRLLEPNNTA